MRLLIAEDEAPARERLIETIARVAPQVVVAGWTASVQATRQWLVANPAPDVLLLDIQLADGLSLELFRDGELSMPTIFTTAYDEFALAAFKALAIDYLLKPVHDAPLQQAFAKVQALRQRFAQPQADALQAALHGAGAVPSREPQRYRQRFVARKGSAFIALPVEQVAYFVSVDKLTFVVGADGARHLLDGSLAEIERELDPQRFFRINRQMVVSAVAVARFMPSGKGRLSLELTPAAGDVQISQERAAAFRNWLAQ